MKKYFLTLFLLVVLVLPVASQAITVAELQAQIVALQAQLAQLLAQQNSGIVINSITAPNSLKVGEVGTWQVNVTAPADSAITYQVAWGEMDGYAGVSTKDLPASLVNQTGTFTHAYSQAGTYTIKFRVFAKGLEKAQSSVTVVVGGNSQGAVPVVKLTASPVKLTRTHIVSVFTGTIKASGGDIYLFKDRPVWISMFNQTRNMSGNTIGCRTTSFDYGANLPVVKTSWGQELSVLTNGKTVSYKVESSCPISEMFSGVYYGRVNNISYMTSPSDQGYSRIDIKEVRSPNSLYIIGEQIVSCKDNQKIGDANGDGLVNSTDYDLVRKLIAALIPQPNNICCVDMDGNGKVLTNDLVKIDRIASGLDPIPGNCSQPSITVLSPNGGEVLTTGKSYPIKWNSTNLLSSENVKIEITYETTDTAYPGGTIIRDWVIEKVSNTGLYTWEIPEYYGLGIKNSSFRINITHSSGVNDSSDKNFSIKMGYSNPTLNVPSPTSGGVYKVMDKMMISWAPCNLSDSFGVTLLKKSDSSYRRWVDLRSAGSCLVSWIIPRDLSGNDYYLRVDTSGMDGTRTGGVGYSGVFSIVNNSSQPSVTILSPNGGEVFTKGSTQIIRWNTNNLPNDAKVNLEIYEEGTDPSLSTAIYHGLSASAGQYSWKIADFPTPNRKYRIILNAFDKTGAGLYLAKDVSDNYFTISDSPTTVSSFSINSITTPVKVDGMVTITGTGFSKTGGNVVNVGDRLKTSMTSSDGTTLKFALLSRVPAGTYPVWVERASIGRSNIMNLTISSSIARAEINTRLSANTPVASNISRSATQITPNIVTSIFGLKSVNEDSRISEIQFRVNGSGDLGALNNWKLVVDSVSYSASSYSNGVITFRNLYLNLLKDQWKDLTLKTDVGPGTNIISVSNTLIAKSLVGVDVNYNSINTDSAVDVTGNVLNFMLQLLNINSITTPVKADGMVTITGTGFSKTGGNVVNVGDRLKTSMTSSDGTTLKFSLLSRVPAGTYPVWVERASIGRSNIMNLTISSSTVTTSVSKTQASQLASIAEALKKLAEQLR